MWNNGNVWDINSTENIRKQELGSTGGVKEFYKEYGIVWFEEMYEYSQQNYLENVGTLRGAKHILTIHSSNPWNEHNWYVRSLLKLLPFSERIMRSRGYNGVNLTLTQKNGQKKKILLIWTNWRVIKEYLTDGDIKRINNYYDISENAGLTADLGKAGRENTGIYAEHLIFVEPKPIWSPASRIGGGGDVGLGRTQHSGITAFIFGEWTTNNVFKILDSFMWDMRKKYINVNDLYRLIINFYKENIITYAKKFNKDIYTIKCEVRVDLSNIEFIENLNYLLEQEGINYLFFTPCEKYEINKRILNTWQLMDSKRLEIDEQRCNGLWAEFESSEWEQKDGKKQRKNKNDHYINAFEYFIEPEMEDGLIMETKNMEKVENKEGWRLLKAN